MVLCFFAIQQTKTHALPCARQRESWLLTLRFVLISHARWSMTRPSKVCFAPVTTGALIWIKVLRSQDRRPAPYRASGWRNRAVRFMRPNGRHSEHKTTGHSALHWGSLLGGNNCSNPALASDGLDGSPIERCDANSRACGCSFNHPPLHKRRLASIRISFRSSDSIFKVIGN